MTTAQNTEPQDESRVKELRCGTLRYTKITITVLFAWLLWGDFCFTLMESVVPSIVPFKLQQLGCSSAMLAMITGTIPSILNLIVCPWVSFKSDRHRSKWGRRIPFILSTMPFLCISLIMMGWSHEIAGLFIGPNPTPDQAARATLWVIAICLIAFNFFNLFVNSVYWYLFNDVVPGHMLGRFMGLFRIVGQLAGILYSFLIFPFGLSHMREIMTGAAILYFVGFGMMCLFVKEGEYPEVEKTNEKHVGPLAEFFGNIKIYAQESFKVPFYWYFYLSQAFGALAGAAGIYGGFQAIELGLDLKGIGYMGGINQIVGIAAIYFSAIYVDRWHPMRVLTYFSVIGVLGGLNGWSWLFIDVPANMYFWMSIAGGFVGVFGGALLGGCLLPAFMRLIPKSRYGQISSAYSMIRSLASILGFLVVGYVMDFTLWACKSLGHGATFGYRWLFIWFGIFNVGAAICYALTYRKWQALGGDHGYKAPAPWMPSGYDDAGDNTPSVPSSPRLLMFSLHAFTACIVATLLAAPLILYLTNHERTIRVNLPEIRFVRDTVSAVSTNIDRRIDAVSKRFGLDKIDKPAHPEHGKIEKPAHAELGKTDKVADKQLHLEGMIPSSFDFHTHNMKYAEEFMRWFYIPAFALLLLVWLRIVFGIRSDLKTVLAGGQSRLGIPHHGVLIVVGIQGFFGVFVGWAQYLWMINLNMQYEMMIVALQGVTGTFFTIVGYQLIRLLEKGPNQQLRVAMPHKPAPVDNASGPAPDPA